MASPRDIAIANLKKSKGRPRSIRGIINKKENDLRIATSKAVNVAIMRKSQALVRAGMIVALGQNFVYRIDEEQDEKGKVTSRKHVLVTDPDEIAKALDLMEEGGRDPEERYYYVTTKEPDHKAIEMLLNRAYGKPKESLDLTGDVKFSLKELAEKRKRLLEGEIIEDEPVALPSEIVEEVPQNDSL